VLNLLMSAHHRSHHSHHSATHTQHFT